MKRLIIAPSAISDLQGIHDFIADDNVGMGRKRDEVVLGHRSVVEGVYVIFYQPMADDTLEIKRVIHSKRDLGKALSE